MNAGDGSGEQAPMLRHSGAAMMMWYRIAPFYGLNSSKPATSKW